MSYDNHQNFAYSTVSTPPSPVDSGTSLTITNSAVFPSAPFNLTVWEANTQPLSSNAEIVRVTAINGSTFTITRAQESSLTRNIKAGDNVAITLSSKIITDLETDVQTRATVAGDIGGTPAIPRLTFEKSTATVSGGYTIDWNTASVFDLTMSGNSTFAITNIPVGSSLALTLRGAYTPTWPTTVWPNGTVPTYTDNGNGMDFVFWVIKNGELRGAAVQTGTTGFLVSTNNLSDLTSSSTARSNLGLGTVSTLTSDTDGTLAANSDIKVATQKATKTYADTKLSLAGGTMTGAILAVAGSAATPGYEVGSGGNGIYQSTTNSVDIATNGVQRWKVGGGGNLSPGTDNTYDVGSNTGPLMIKDGWFKGALYLRGGTTSFIELVNQTAVPSAPSAGGRLYVANLGGRPTLYLEDLAGISNSFHPSWSSALNFSVYSGTQSGNIGFSGAQATLNGTSSLVTATETLGLLTQCATSGGANANSGVQSTNKQFFLGSGTAGGAFYSARIYLPDASYDNTGASTGTRLFCGFSDQNFATTLGSDDPAGNRAGFSRLHVNGGVTDTTWFFSTKDNTTETRTDTTMTFTAQHMYDFFIWMQPNSNITWQVKDITAGTSASGTASTHLPTGSTAMRSMLGLLSVDAVARNIDFRHLNTTSPR